MGEVEHQVRDGENGLTKIEGYVRRMDVSHGEGQGCRHYPVRIFLFGQVSDVGSRSKVGENVGELGKDALGFVDTQSPGDHGLESCLAVGAKRVEVAAD